MPELLRHFSSDLKLFQPDHESISVKTGYEHPDDPRKIILTTENPDGWAAEYEEYEDWHPADRFHYWALHFYTRRLAHLLLPQWFPNCYAANDHVLVAQRIYGLDLEWRYLEPTMQEQFLQAVSQIGLNQEALDLRSRNFIETPTGQLFYVDDIVDLEYFDGLGRFRTYGTTWGSVPFEVMAKEENWPVERMKQKWVRPELFDKDVLEQHCQTLTDPHLQGMVKRTKARFQAHLEYFPVIDLLDY